MFEFAHLFKTRTDTTQLNATSLPDNEPVFSFGFDLNKACFGCMRTVLGDQSTETWREAMPIMFERD